MGAMPEEERPHPLETDPEAGKEGVGEEGEEGRCGRTQRPSWPQLQGKPGEE